MNQYNSGRSVLCMVKVLLLVYMYRGVRDIRESESRASCERKGEIVCFAIYFSWPISVWES
jgi:hypothetical protein